MKLEVLGYPQTATTGSRAEREGPVVSQGPLSTLEPRYIVTIEARPIE